MFLSFSWIDQINTAIYNGEFLIDNTVSGWLLTHVKKPLGFSSVVPHKYHAFDEFMFTGVNDFVVEVPSIPACSVLWHWKRNHLEMT